MWNKAPNSHHYGFASQFRRMEALLVCVIILVALPMQTGNVNFTISKTPDFNYSKGELVLEMVIMVSAKVCDLGNTQL